MFFKNKKKYKMIDVHCHVLPGVDDGSSSMEETMQMLKIASDNGIEKMIVTPHYKNGRKNATPQKIKELIATITEKLQEEGIDIELYPGNELYYFSDSEKEIEAGNICSLNDTNRILIEFTPNESFQYIRNALENIAACGYVPVIAHIERYTCFLSDFRYVLELCELGVEIQVNISSIEGRLGSQVKAFTRELLKRQYIDYLGTDTHDSKKRIPDVSECLAMLYKKYDPDYIDQIVYGRANALIEVEE